MGRNDPERLQAIEASLSAMTPCVEETIIEGSDQSYGEEAVEIEMDYSAYTEASAIYSQLKLQGKTPVSWWRDQQRTDYNQRIYFALEDIWEAREEPLDPEGVESLTDQEVAEEKWEEELTTGRFDSPADHLDEWSGPAIPMSAVENFGVERDGNDSSAEKLLRDILHGEPDDSKCPNCGLMEIGCALAGCNVNVNAIDDTTQIS